MNCDQLKQINIGEGSFYYYESFECKNLPSLISIQLQSDGFHICNSVVFESMNDWMNDEWDLNQLQSIILEFQALCGDYNMIESNELIMRSNTDNDDWLIRSSFSVYIQRSWFQFQMERESDIREWWLIIEYELDIPSLIEDGIQISEWNSFYNVQELHSSSMINWLLMIEMLILLID